MARKYRVVLRNVKTYETVTVEGYGNTKRSAEQSARSQLRRERKLETTKDWYRAQIKFAGSY